mmetsp:Transcript_11061/g.31299  ORF Transcript_11061/g.31299 Transcript_11061/m.31299 type:complete len:207 (-) Transcript_11061:843-1463(-)
MATRACTMLHAAKCRAPPRRSALSSLVKAPTPPRKTTLARHPRALLKPVMPPGLPVLPRSFMTTLLSRLHRRWSVTRPLSLTMASSIIFSSPTRSSCLPAPSHTCTPPWKSCVRHLKSGVIRFTTQGKETSKTLSRSPAICCHIWFLERTLHKRTASRTEELTISPTNSIASRSGKDSMLRPPKGMAQVSSTNFRVTFGEPGACLS